MRRLPVRAGSLLIGAAAFVVWQFETGRAGIGERPALAVAAPGTDPTADVPATPVIEGSTTASATEATSLVLGQSPPYGSVGLDEPCPDGTTGTICAVHVDLGGSFATTRAPGRFGIWCEDGQGSFRPATTLDRDVRLVGTATDDYRTVLVLELSSDDPSGLPTFATLRRDPSATGGWGAGCPTLQELGTGLPIDHEVPDPYVPTPGGVPLLLSSGGVLVRPTQVGVELVRVTPEIPSGEPVSAEEPASGGE